MWGKWTGAGSLLIAYFNWRDSTVHILLRNGAKIILCTKDRISPHIYAFVNIHNETVNILSNNAADSCLACGCIYIWFGELRY